MSESEDVEVIQGRLGWESGDVSEASVSELEPHPRNEAIYGDTEPDELDDTFLNSIREKGVLEPLVITKDKRIISGHRRWQAAREVGETRVPVRVSEFDDDLAEREAVVEFNRQREKTPGQIVNEFEEILEIEQQRAKERQGERTDLKDNSEHLGNISEKSDSVEEAREKAAEKVNAEVSGRTLEKGIEVKEKAEDGDETAQEAWEDLRDGEVSFNGAYTKVKDGGDSSDDSDIEQFTSQQTDEWSSPREIVDPIDDAIGGFDLDPCSGAETSPFAADTYTEDDDGLQQDWHGSVWVNPPYSAVADWVTKATTETRTDRVKRVVFLCKGDSSTDWWQQAADAAELICAVDHRLSFGDGENSAPFASHIFVFGQTTEELADSLRQHGTLLTTGWSS